jgi:hypothetical protein
MCGVTCRRRADIFKKRASNMFTSIMTDAGKLAMTEEQLKDLFYDLTQARHPGWENNDGAFGEFNWDLTEEDALKHTHNDRFTDYDTTEHEGL